MKQLSDNDIANMITTDYIPDSGVVNHVRKQLHISTRIVHDEVSPTHVKLDLHMHTIEQSWAEIMELATSGVKNATIITGASGILKIKFQQWVSDSILTPYIVSCSPINNGSFSVKFRKTTN